MQSSEPLLNPSAARLCLSTELGVEHVVLDTRGLLQAAGVWSTRRC
jgi:hypothetical protein